MLVDTLRERGFHRRPGWVWLMGALLAVDPLKMGQVISHIHHSSGLSFNARPLKRTILPAIQPGGVHSTRNISEDRKKVLETKTAR
jgi:hypothetical protein